MRTVLKPVAIAFTIAVPLFAGGLMLQIGNPAANPEALAKKAVLVARITACGSPEKAKLAASAEGIVDGDRRSIPLDVIPLSTAGTFAITRQWPQQGTWAVKLSAANPDYKGYATGMLVSFEANAVQWASAEHFAHEPTEAEVIRKIAAQTAMVHRQ